MSELATPAPVDITKEKLRCPKCGSYHVTQRSVSVNKTHSGGKARDGWDYVKLHERMCHACDEFNAITDDDPACRATLDRWNNPAYVNTYTPEDLRRDIKANIRAQDEAERNITWPPSDPTRREFYEKQHAERLREAREDYRRSVPENEELLAAILADPDDDALRRQYAAWMRVQPPATRRAREYRGGWVEELYESSSSPELAAWYIDAQLNVHEAFRKDPRTDVRPLLLRNGYQRELLPLRAGLVGGYGNYDLFTVNDFTEQWFYVRGFIEHLAIKAPAFLTFADFLYQLAPLRHLTFTYSRPVLSELMASPHLARLHSIFLPNRMPTNHYTRLNELTDDDVRVIAQSPHLGKLAYLDLEDATDLTPRALDHLALSLHLTSLSCLRLDVYAYDRVWGNYGDYRQRLIEHRIERWRDELEARHGYLPWLHPEEHYGTPAPIFEMVTAHPVGRADFRPDVAARCRPRLPPALADALTAALAPDGTLRDRSLVVPLPTGRLVATLEHAHPDPQLPDLRTLVTLTFQTVPQPFPVYDFATQRTITATPRTTATLGVPRTRS
jgi:hypothetical protein